MRHWQESPSEALHPPSFTSRFACNENPEEESVDPPGRLRPPPPVAFEVDSVVDLSDVLVVPEVVDPDVVDREVDVPDVVADDVDVVVAVAVEPEALEVSLDEDSSDAGSSSCCFSGTV